MIKITPPRKTVSETHSGPDNPDFFAADSWYNNEGEQADDTHRNISIGIGLDTGWKMQRSTALCSNDWKQLTGHKKDTEFFKGKE